MRAFPSTPAWLVLLLVSVALAGCSEEAPAPLDAELPTDAVVSEDGRDLRLDLTADDRLPGPTWRVGDWFGHHIFFGSEDNEGTHINVVVTEDRGSDWYLVSEDPEVAMFEAIMDVPIAGTLSKKDLDTTAFGGPWQVYDFPMGHNKTWTGTLTVDTDWAYDLTYTATYQEEFKTALGNRPGFLVTGVDPEGRTVLETDYVPAIGWHTSFVMWDVESEDPEDFVFRSISMGTGHDWTGDYVDYEAEVLLETSADVNPGQPGAPGHAEGVAVDAETSLIAGILYSYAATGASTLRLVDPAGTVQVEQTSTHASADGGTGTGDFYVLDASPGDWHLAWSGPAMASGFGAFLWGLKELPGSLGGDPGDDG